MTKENEDAVELMDVDSTTNENTLEKPCLSPVQSDDAALLFTRIPTNERDNNLTKITPRIESSENQSTEQDDEEVLSDKDDCAVIEDDDKREVESTMPRSRQRKSAV